jgi:cytochrome aa3-600 menaquinol oxidase subunit 2
VDIKEHAEEIWFIVMLVIVAAYSIWNAYYILTGRSFSIRYGEPLFSGLPKEAQSAVIYFESHPPNGGYSEVINGTLVVNLTAVQYKWIPNVIVVNESEPVVLIINSPQVDTGFFLRLPNGVINVNNVPGITSYVYFIAPNQPGNYTWYNAEYDGYASSYMTGTLVVLP